MMSSNDEVDDVQMDAEREDYDPLSHSLGLSGQCIELSEETSLKFSASNSGFQSQSTEQSSNSMKEKRYLDYVGLMPEEYQEDNIDVLIINSEDDRTDAFAFKKHLESDIIINCNGMSLTPKVCLLEEMFPGEHVNFLDSAMEKTEYVFLFVTKQFVEDTWSLFKGQACLIEALREKKWCVVPVHTRSRRRMDYKLPITLGNLRPLQYWSNDQFYTDAVRKLLETRIHNRITKDCALNNERKVYFQKNEMSILEKANFIQEGNTVRKIHYPEKEGTLVEKVDFDLEGIKEFTHVGEPCVQEERSMLSIKKVLDAENQPFSKETKLMSGHQETCLRAGSHSELNQLTEALKNVKLKPNVSPSQFAGHVSLRSKSPPQKRQIFLPPDLEKPLKEHCQPVANNESLNVAKSYFPGTKGLPVSSVEMVVADCLQESGPSSVGIDGPSLDYAQSQSRHMSSPATHRINHQQLISQSVNIPTSQQQMAGQSINAPTSHQQFPQMIPQLVQDPRTGQCFYYYVPLQTHPYPTNPTIQPQPASVTHSAQPVTSILHPAQPTAQSASYVANAGTGPANLTTYSPTSGPPFIPQHHILQNFHQPIFSLENPNSLHPTYSSTQSFDSMPSSVEGQANSTYSSSQFISHPNFSMGGNLGINSNVSSYSSPEGSSMAQSSVGPNESQDLRASAGSMILNMAPTPHPLGSHAPSSMHQRPVEQHIHINVQKVTNLAVGENPAIKNIGNSSRSDEDDDDDDSDENSDEDESAEDTLKCNKPSSVRGSSNGHDSSSPTPKVDVSAEVQSVPDATYGFPECPDPVSLGEFSALSVDETELKEV